KSCGRVSLSYRSDEHRDKPSSFRVRKRAAWTSAGDASLQGSLSAGDRPDDEKGLRSRRDRVGQRSVGRLIRQVLLTGEEPQHRSAPPGDAVADCPPQHRIAGLQRVQDRTLCGRAVNGEMHLTVDVRQRPQMVGKHDSDHGRVGTSTDTTGGRWETMGIQLSPALADAYTCPPVVPK